MEPRTPIASVLRVVSELGAATLESIIIWLEPETTAIDTARAFQTARARAWIEQDEHRDAPGADPAYRLTRLGSDELARTISRSGDGKDVVGRDRDGDVPIEAVLRVVADFERSGGASVQLIAWELDVDQSVIIAAWTQARNDGLIERCGSEVVDGREEEMWRLADADHGLRRKAGRRASSTQSDLTPPLFRDGRSRASDRDAVLREQAPDGGDGDTAAAGAKRD